MGKRSELGAEGCHISVGVRHDDLRDDAATHSPVAMSCLCDLQEANFYVLLI